jgi:hypothetical protein
MEDQDFIVLDYEEDGKKTKELSTLNEKALLSITPEKVQEWKGKYKFENINPSYAGPFHPVVRKCTDLIVEQNFGKFWKKKVANGKPVVSLYLLMPLKIENLAAEIDTSMEVLVPILYEVDRGEVKIDAIKVYDLVCCNGKIEDLDDPDTEILEEARKQVDRDMDKIEGKIRAGIEKVRIEIEELALERQRSEIQRKIEEKNKKLESLNGEINRKRNSGLNYEKEMHEAKKTKEELDELQKLLEIVPESCPGVSFGESQIVGGCIYFS